MAEVISRFSALHNAMAQRRADGLWRELKPRAVDSALIDLSNNDYLRLSQHPEVIAAAQTALSKWGASASASPLISGYTEAHAELEQQLARWAGFDHGLVWNTGYAANQAVLSCLPQAGDVVLADRLIHHSMIAGILRSGARLQRYQHLDVDHLEHCLKQHAGRSVFVVTESLFSMDGDYPDLAAMAGLKARHGFTWIVDEAHAIGWYGTKGSGLVEAAGVAGAVDVYVGTLGKGLGSMGAFTLFQDAALRDYLINFASEFIFSTYLAPSCATAASKAVELAVAMSPQRSQWQARSSELRAAISSAPAGDSPIIPLAVGNADRVMFQAAALRERGFLVGAVRPPTVPANSSRLRISLNMALRMEDEARLLEALKEVWL